ncbi:MAG: helix-turn-helix transcriptional regulator [Clostridiales bacterium]|nr:helix-turn-helix transcriptional regulator [Clostridiales bacterium]
MSFTIFSNYGDADIVEQDEQHISYRQKKGEGEGVASVYPVFPGIEVIVLDYQTSLLNPTIRKQLNVLEINHCLEGRAECRMKDGCLQYIGEGDLFLNTLNNYSDSIELPLGFYRGLMVLIDLDTAEPVISELFCGISISICELCDRFFADDECFLIHAKDEIRHIFARMYTIPHETRSFYYRLKIQELLLYLHYFDPLEERQSKGYAREQVEMVKMIQKRITGEPKRRFTIEELAKEYCISPTALKSSFKGVYGLPIAAYMKEYRIRQAAVLLRETTMSIADIAAEMGYESQSKFGAAFKETMKITPLEYRKKLAQNPSKI